MVEFIIRRMEEKRECLRTRNVYDTANPEHKVLHQEITHSDFCGTCIETENYLRIFLGI